MKDLKAFINKDVLKRMRHNDHHKYYYLLMPFDNFYYELKAISELSDNMISTGRCDAWLLTADDVEKKLVKYCDDNYDWEFAVIKNKYKTFIDALKDIQNKLEDVDTFEELENRYEFDIIYGNNHVDLIAMVREYEKY